ncbi:DKNYY domain-containing protein [Escherichia coli]|uniref:DKNYY domain-containing protein n=1 Tax=Escherichia coli TaxID=562 RepID=UPI001CBB54DC|nr:DKNYY domain-containing protein [Escherichia coli]UAO53913.1 DKNYY domain-containing protein [Escherichia coli]UAO62995.1 DKNYY domain-containing protein [Escherichia coli]UAO67639.1 DKNYY domain-containing protein [Escherichia coli]
MELLKKNQWTMKKFFKGSLLISSMLLTSSCTINQCTLELHDGDKVEQKSCRTKGKQLGKNYAIYNNKIWFVTANYDFYHGDEIGGGGGGCPNPSCFNLSLPSITVSPNVTSEKYIYTLLPLDVNKARVLMSNYITDGEKVFYSGKEISNINAKFFNAMIWYPVKEGANKFLI